MFDVPLSEISEIHFKPHNTISFIKVVTKSNKIRIHNLHHYPINNILLSLETYLYSYEQLMFNIKEDLQYTIFVEIKHYVENKLWKQNSHLHIPYKFELKNIKTNKIRTLDTNIIFKTYQVENKDYLIYKSLRVNWNTCYDMNDIKHDIKQNEEIDGVNSSQ